MEELIYEYMNENNRTLDELEELLSDEDNYENTTELYNAVQRYIKRWMANFTFELWRFRDITAYTTDALDFIVNADFGTYARIGDVAYFKVRSNDNNLNEPKVVTFDGYDWRID